VPPITTPKTRPQNRPWSPGAAAARPLVAENVAHAATRQCSRLTTRRRVSRWWPSLEHTNQVIHGCTHCIAFALRWPRPRHNQTWDS
jgi:hypothetical protein